MSASSRCRAVHHSRGHTCLTLIACSALSTQTPNTLTINSGVLSRSVQVHRPFRLDPIHRAALLATPGCVHLTRYRPSQIITRLYASRDDILNGFDIDCCCCGFDGEHALITPRAIAAITTRVNTVDLDIRGESYELRLLKYVERGFAIGVPRLVRAEIDREHLSFKFGEHPWWGGISIDSGEGWRRWTSASGLELLLMAEQLARGFEGDGEVPWPLPGRRRSAKVHHEDPNLKFQAKRKS